MLLEWWNQHIVDLDDLADEKFGLHTDPLRVLMRFLQCDQLLLNGANLPLETL